MVRAEEFVWGVHETRRGVVVECNLQNFFVCFVVVIRPCAALAITSRAAPFGVMSVLAERIGIG